MRKRKATQTAAFMRKLLSSKIKMFRNKDLGENLLLRSCQRGKAATIGVGFPSASSGTIRNRVRRFFSFFRTEKRFP